jgi:uncharacterized coiled-coil protein SlyX
MPKKKSQKQLEREIARLRSKVIMQNKIIDELDNRLQWLEWNYKWDMIYKEREQKYR